MVWRSRALGQWSSRRWPWTSVLGESGGWLSLRSYASLMQPYDTSELSLTLIPVEGHHMASGLQDLLVFLSLDQNVVVLRILEGVQSSLGCCRMFSNF